MALAKKIIISRTDSIGDVVLTLPLAGILKRQYPQYEIIFLGRTYTKEVVDCCKYVDSFINWDSLQKMNNNEACKALKALNSDVIIHVFPRKQIARLAKKARIPLRIGTSHRYYHWLTCNKLVSFSRKKSSLHEAQLNIKLIAPLIGDHAFSLDEIAKYIGVERITPLQNEIKAQLSSDKFNLVLHPRSKGSAREWSLENYVELIKILPPEKYKIFVTGTLEEGAQLKELFRQCPQAIDFTGKFKLSEFISFLANVDGMVAASTGPLHIASVLGKHTIGLYPSIRPMHPGRWSPLGERSSYLVFDKECNDCRKKTYCECINAIRPEQVKARLDSCSKIKQ